MPPPSPPHHPICACPALESVDLTEAYISRHTRNCQSNSATPPLDADRLLRNLEQNGWSPIFIRLAVLPETSSLGEFWKDPRPAILRLFECGPDPFPNASFYAAESGAVGTSIEPKQSWEVRRCGHCNQYQPEESTILDHIAQAMHSIIGTVTWLLQLPPNLLHQDGSCSCQRGDGPCNVDLLRAFHYQKVEPNDQEILGSSAHTDWGTWTVVWQDHVGGLQTHCPTCQAWRDVPAFPWQPGVLRFVIHVGDSTSLAMAHGRQLLRQPQSSGHAFPSPKHRVLAPVTEPRSSLVYFVYPPPGHSLESMALGLAPWIERRYPDGKANSTSTSSTIPHDQYYLLRDQSAGADGHAKRTAKEVLDAIYSQPMQKVFAEKWQQVQRSG